MKLITYRANKISEARLGVIHNEQVVDVNKLGLTIGYQFPDSMLELIDQGPDAISALSDALKERGGRMPPGIAIPEANVSLLAPIPTPRKNIFGIGLTSV